MIDPNKVILNGEQSDAIIGAQAAEIARLREAIRRLADQDATLSAQDGNVTVDIDGITLTDAEREALEQAIDAADGMQDAEPWTAATLRSLLARLA